MPDGFTQARKTISLNVLWQRQYEIASSTVSASGTLRENPGRVNPQRRACPRVVTHRTLGTEAAKTSHFISPVFYNFHSQRGFIHRENKKRRVATRRKTRRRNRRQTRAAHAGFMARTLGRGTITSHRGSATVGVAPSAAAFAHYGMRTALSDRP